MPKIMHSRSGVLHRDIAGALMQALLVLVALVGAAPVRADDELPGRVGRVADVGGDLFLAPQDAPDLWNAIGQNYPVTTGDNLWVGSEGRAEIDFGGGQFRLGGATSLHISRLDDRNFALFIAQGSVIVRVRVLEPGESARVDTPNAQVVLTRPGLYRIEAAEDRQHTQIAVREGLADVDTGTAVQQVLPGQSATLDGSAPQYALLRYGVATDALDTWSANRDRRYERGRANAPVSRQMVGYSDLDEYGTWDQAPEYGGAVWYPANVAGDWAPYRNGYWTDVGAWGPTWVDAAPWGYAPFHYGRWAFIRGRWGWCPGGYVVRPVWAPALVGWVGGPGWRVAIGGAPVYGWVPLGWGEPYQPHWRGCSDRCWTRFNQPYAVNVNVRSNTPPARYANWNAPGAVTAVPGAAFAGRKPVANNLVAVNGSALATAPVMAAPPMRTEVRPSTGIKPGNGLPLPASVLYAATPRQPRTASPTSASPAPVLPAAVPIPPRTATSVVPQPDAPAARTTQVAPAPNVGTYSPPRPPTERPAPLVSGATSGAGTTGSGTTGARQGALPASIEPKPRAQAIYQPNPAPKPVVRTERVQLPASLAPAPASPAPVAHPVAVAPAPHAVEPAAPHNGPPARHQQETGNADKPPGPAVRGPADAPAK